MEKKDTRKNIKIPEKIHTMLKKHCNDNGLKLEWFVSKIIEENCRVEK